jgi:uncharacterized repeat protein (TIGR02543 family)
VITLEAVADVGYVFTGWTQDLTGMTNPGTLIMDCGKFVTATFKKVVYQSDIVVVAPNKIYDGNNLVVGGSAFTMVFFTDKVHLISNLLLQLPGHLLHILMRLLKTINLLPSVV